MKIFSKNLKRIRESKKFSQAEMAKYLGVSPSTYNTYEKGRKEIGDREPNLSTLKKIADILEVKVDKLLSPTFEDINFKYLVAALIKRDIKRGEKID